MDQYISWGLSKEEMNLDTIWERFEDFCKPQSNEVRAQVLSFNTFSAKVIKTSDEWYNAVQAQVNLVKYPPRNSHKYYIEIFSGSSYM